MVIDVLSTNAMTAGKAIGFFETTSTNLLRAEQEAGVRHHVALSIVGIDRVPSGYYQGKLRQEEVVAAGPVPWTILRATQFHEFALQRLDVVRDRLIALVPSMLSQPIAAVEVAEALVAHATEIRQVVRRTRRPRATTDGLDGARPRPCHEATRAGPPAARPGSGGPGDARRRPAPRHRRPAGTRDLRGVARADHLT